MLSLLYKLQRKPENARKKIALLFSISLTGVIVLLWVVNLSFTEGTPKAASGTEEAGPFKALTEGVDLFFTSTAETLQSAAGIFSGFSKERSASTTTAQSESVSE